MFKDVAGVTYYYQWLIDYDSRLETLVCLHGFTGTSNTFTPVFCEVTTYNVLGIDVIGHGQSDKDVPIARYEMTSVVRDIKTLVEGLTSSPFSLLGYSMGARVALSFACTYPECLSQLFLESGSPGIEDDAERLVRRQSDDKLAQSLIHKGLSYFVNQWETIPLFDTQKKLPLEVIQQVRCERMNQTAYGLAMSLRYMGTGSQRSYWKMLHQLGEMPCYLLVGELDLKFCHIAKDMASRGTNMEVISFEGAGHCVHLEVPILFNQVVTNRMEQVN